MKKQNKCVEFMERIISWVKRFYGYDTKPEKTANAPKTKIKQSYSSYKSESNAEDVAVEDELVAMSLLENDGNEK